MFTCNWFSSSTFSLTSFLGDAVTAPLPAGEKPSAPSNSVLDECELPSACSGSFTVEQGYRNDTDNSVSPSSLVYVGLETNTYEALFTIVSKHATINQFTLRKEKKTHNFTEEDATTFFGSSDTIPQLIPQRGKLHCRSNLVEGDACPFTVAYAFDKKRKLYVVKDKDFNLSHNHALRPPVQIEGVKRITRECDLRASPPRTLYRV